MYFKEIPIEQIEEPLLLSNSQELPPLSSGELDELRDSVREFGIIQPLIVTVNDNGGYLRRAGKNRYRIARELGMKLVPCYVAGNNDEVTEIRMGLHTDVYRRHLTPEKKNEIVKWLKGLQGKNTKPPASPPGSPGKHSKKRSAKASPKSEEMSKLENKLQKKQERIESLEIELKETEDLHNIRTENLEKEIKSKKDDIKGLRDELQRARDDAEEARFQKTQVNGPTKDEIVKKLQNDVEDANNRANRISDELEKKRKQMEGLDAELKKAQSESAHIVREHVAILYKEKQIHVIGYESYHIRRSLAEIQNQIEEEIQTRMKNIDDLVKNIKIHFDKKELLNALEATKNSLDMAIKSLAEIPEYQEEEGEEEKKVSSG